MNYEPLLERLAELRAAASLERPLCACGEDCLNDAAFKALAAPAHEYAAVALAAAALSEAIRRYGANGKRTIDLTAVFAYEDAMTSRLAALTMVLGCEVEA